MRVRSTARTYEDVLADIETEQDYRESLISPFIIETFYSNEDVADMWATRDPRTAETKLLRAMVSKLSKTDRDLYKMLYVKQLSQAEIARELKTSQPTISHRIKSLGSKIMFLSELPDCTECIQKDMPKLTTQSRKYIEMYLKVPNQNAVAKALDVSAVTVSGHIKNAIGNTKLSAEFREYLKLLLRSPNNLTLG